MAFQIRFLAKYCGSNPSFTSSHALNHFAFAAFVVSSFKGVSKWIYLLFVWAAIISYSQVYVGVHYPSDVIAGGLLGTLLGGIGYGITKQALSLHQPQP
jgi:undecaprenyl-diphosphatase